MKTSLDINITASLVPAHDVVSRPVAPGNILTLTGQSFDKCLSITPFKIESRINTQLFGKLLLGFSS